ncbi:hypothetical protein PQR15_09100 [Streptomyces lydicus]|nr:hypothetical protein [Streptomyces lydicus]
MRQAALRLLSRAEDEAHHGSALALLIGDPAARPRFLDRALARFVAGDPQLPPTAFEGALTDDPGRVLAAFRARLVGDEGRPWRARCCGCSPAWTRRRSPPAPPGSSVPTPATALTAPRTRWPRSSATAWSAGRPPAPRSARSRWSC